MAVIKHMMGKRLEPALAHKRERSRNGDGADGKLELTASAPLPKIQQVTEQATEQIMKLAIDLVTKAAIEKMVELVTQPAIENNRTDTGASGGVSLMGPMAEYLIALTIEQVIQLKVNMLGNPLKEITCWHHCSVSCYPQQREQWSG